LKQTPLQQAQSIPTNDSNPALKTGGLGITRSSSILSQASHMSDSGSNNAPNPGKSIGRDWLGRSRSQPRLPLYPQESYISVRSGGRSSLEDRARSPPNSGQAKVPPLINLTYNSCINDLDPTVVRHRPCPSNQSTITPHQ
jgi:hypothetical protein